MSDTTGQDLREDSNDTAQGCVVFIVVLFLGFLAVNLVLYLLFRPFSEGPKGVPLDTRWETWEVVLGPSEVSEQGHLHLVVPDPDVGNMSATVSIGVPGMDPGPSPSPALAPADLLALPRVRLSVIAVPGHATTCLAPCEQRLGDGTWDAEILVEAVDGAPAGPLRVTVGAGVIGTPGTPLTDGVDVEIGPGAGTRAGG